MLITCKFLIPNVQIMKLDYQKINELFIKTTNGLIPLFLYPKTKFILVYKNFFYFLFSSFT